MTWAFNGHDFTHINNLLHHVLDANFGLDWKQEYKFQHMFENFGSILSLKIAMFFFNISFVSTLIEI